MGYFANGTDGEAYLDRYCFHCKNWALRRDDVELGCPVMDLHLFYGYKLCNSKSLAKKIIDSLIPFTSGGGNGECALYLPVKSDSVKLLRRAKGQEELGGFIKVEGLNPHTSRTNEPDHSNFERYFKET